MATNKKIFNKIFSTFQNQILHLDCKALNIRTRLIWSVSEPLGPQQQKQQQSYLNPQQQRKQLQQQQEHVLAS